MIGSELEFYLFHDSYDSARAKHYRELTPSIPYILDYHVLATTMDESYVGALRRGMKGAGLPVEFSKGEAWHGQHELNFRFDNAVTMADRHVIYKKGAKEIAHQQGKAVTFMAKPATTGSAVPVTSTPASGPWMAARASFRRKTGRSASVRFSPITLPGSPSGCAT